MSDTPAPAQELAEFLAENLPDWRARWNGEDSFEAALDWQRIMQTGQWVAPEWSVENGGRGLDVLSALACAAVLAENHVPRTAGIFGVKNVGPTIAAYGTPEQREHLPRILRGDEIWCQGFSEPGTGSDLAGLQTRAELDGDEFVINGQKVWTSSGMRADHMELLVRTDRDAPKHKGISALLIELDTPGIERRPIRQITGGSEFAEVFFTDVRVPRSSLLGPMNGGWGVTMTTLSFERSGVVAFAKDIEQEVEALVSANSAAAGAPALSADNRDQLVRRFVEGRLLGALGNRSLASIVATGEPGAEQSIIKLLHSQVTQRLAATRVALGGMAALTGADDDAELAYLGARSADIAGGTTEIMKNILAKRVLGMPSS
ncbi:acyl-CoA dehydrogenase family protein [Jatrophihabitans sp. DSM 45814]